VLVNTDRVNGEQLGEMDELDGYLDDFGWTGRRDKDAAELSSVHRIAGTARQDLGRRRRGERAVGRVNELLSGSRAMPWLTSTPRMPEWHLHLASIHDPCGNGRAPGWRWRWPTSFAPRIAEAEGLRRAGL